MRRLRLKRFEEEARARAWARAFNHARTFNRMPLLEAEWDSEDGFWWVVNPDADAPARIPRTPMKPGLFGG